MRAAAVSRSAASATAVAPASPAAVVAALLLLALAPAASARPATLYAHVTGPADGFALNTQAPPDPFTLDAGFGALAATATCVPPNQAYASSDLHRLHGFATPHAVDYAEGEARIRPERGLDGDVPLLGGSMLHWYWSAEGAGPAPALPAPEVVVRATLRASDAIDPDGLAYEEGAVVAVGESRPALLAGPASQGVAHDEVDGRTVYHFEVPMAVDPANAVLPRAAFSLWVETFVRSGACEGGHLMPPAVRLHSSAGHRPRLELDAAPHLALLATDASIQVSEGEPTLAALAFRALLLDAWGRYDLRTVEATAEGPGLPPTAMEPMAVLQTEHRAFQDSGPWPLGFYVAERPFPAGGYTFRLSASTLQGLNETWEVTYRLGEEAEAPGPGFGPAALALAAAVAAAAFRRRR